MMKRRLDVCGCGCASGRVRYGQKRGRERRRRGEVMSMAGRERERKGKARDVSKVRQRARARCKVRGEGREGKGRYMTGARRMKRPSPPQVQSSDSSTGWQFSRFLQPQAARSGRRRPGPGPGLSRACRASLRVKKSPTRPTAAPIARRYGAQHCPLGPREVPCGYPRYQRMGAELTAR